MQIAALFLFILIALGAFGLGHLVLVSRREIKAAQKMIEECQQHIRQLEDNLLVLKVESRLRLPQGTQEKLLDVMALLDSAEEDRAIAEIKEKNLRARLQAVIGTGTRYGSRNKE